MGRIHLDHVTKRYGDVVTAVDDVSLEVGDGEFVVLVGPSGCGKSTLLRMIAGLEAITEGRVHVGEKDVTDIPPRDRDIAMVFQNYALYPQMSVRQNLAFGLKVRRTPKDEINRRVDQVARTLRLDELLERRPGELSGGQRQRVAIGRAMVREPNAFLMDEPLSNLDAKLRSAMRLELAALHERLGVTTVFVTHDQVEAMTLGQRVAVLRAGTLQQYDTPQALFRTPANLFVATFIGSPAMNVYPAVIADDSVVLGDTKLALPADSRLRAHQGKVLLGVRPTDFRPAVEDSEGRLPRMTVDVALVEDLGADTNVVFNTSIPESELPEIASDLVDSDDQLLAGQTTLRSLARVSSTHAVEPGSRAELAVEIDRVHVFDPTTGAALV